MVHSHIYMIGAAMSIPVVPIVLGVLLLIVAFFAWRFVTKSIHSIGPDQFGLVEKRFGKKLNDGHLIAFHGEAGYQAELLQPGTRFKLWPIFLVKKCQMVQVPPDEIGVVVAQVGEELPQGVKTGVDKEEFGSFADLNAFLSNGGQRGVQRKVLPPGTTQQMHPIAFVVQTASQTFGEVLSESTKNVLHMVDRSKFKPFTIRPEGHTDKVGVVTTLEGAAAKGIASRLGGYDDVIAAEAEGIPANTIITKVLAPQNEVHDNYQDFQAFLDAGGCIGLQHDPLLYGQYLLNPYLVEVEIRDMLVVRQGEVAVIKAYVGLPTEDTSGNEFKFGSIVKPGHQGIWSEPMRTGKYTLNPRIYEAEIVPTSILTLNWANATSEAHDLDARLSAIDAKSREAFDFSIDLQVQIHVPDTRAPKVISMVATMQNLVNEVLQSAVGNYFRNKLQSLGAAEFIQKRDEVQAAAEHYVTTYLTRYEVEVRGVYIQDVVFPPELVEVLTKREIAAQQKATYESEMVAEQARIALENQKGVADAQANLARANVNIEVMDAEAKAAVKQAEGMAAVTRQKGQAAADVTRLTGDADASAIQATGLAEAETTKAKGLAVAAGYEAQKDAIGPEQTAVVAALHEIGDGNINLTPDILVGGQGAGSGMLDALLAMAIRNGADGGSFMGSNDSAQPEPVIDPTTEATPSEGDSSAVTVDEGMTTYE